MKTISLQISESDAGERIDKYLSTKMPEYSRSYFLGLMQAEKVLVNDRIMKPSYKLLAGDTIDLELSGLPKQADPVAENIPLDIIYEDPNVIVLNKQSGMVVHPGTENTTGTLVNALINYYPDIVKAVYEETSTISKARPGLVHRLDKDTSGVMIVAKNKEAMEILSKQVHDRKIGKIYLALCFGTPKNSSGTLRSHLGRDPKHRMKIADIGEGRGKEAISYYKVVKYLKGAHNQTLSLVEIKLKTGRTHQIRVQMSMIGNPVLGDDLYGNKESKDVSTFLGVKRQLLHASTLSIQLPGKSSLSTFKAPLPPDFEEALGKLVAI